MTDKELTRLVAQLSLQYFHKPFADQACFNSRLRTTGGRYLLHNRRIEINPKYYKEIGRDELIAIIKHELCHYHLHIEGKGYRHGDEDFKQLLKQTGSPRHCKTLPSYQEQERAHHHYQCLACKQNYTRKKRMDVARYRCGRCNGRIIYLK
ncbi:SprT-like protein [Amphibacillus marinus]|uniref:Protein SprT-like n=1 Tax=Amphibacillus marinus TaxID=872970 RepID=A0A1H8JM63_9BACI|nr:SprT family protein [Amphibacillus marinus]SEN81853.1 SprT-like protein [Amphibacillus marinus]